MIGWAGWGHSPIMERWFCTRREWEEAIENMAQHLKANGSPADHYLLSVIGNL